MEKGKIPEENQVSNTSSSETQTDRKKDALMMPEGKNMHKQNRKIKWLSSNESMGVLVSHPGVERFCLRWHWSAWQLFLWLPPPIYRWPNNVRPYPKCKQQYLNSPHLCESRTHTAGCILLCLCSPRLVWLTDHSQSQSTLVSCDPTTTVVRCTSPWYPKSVTTHTQWLQQTTSELK